MSLEDDIRTLNETPLLGELSRDALRLIAFSADRVRLDVGDVLFREGEPADSGYVLIAGEIALARGDSQKTVGRGALIGELALICDTTRPATATASEPAELIRIARGFFARLFDEYPDLTRKLHARLAARVKSNLGDLKTLEALLRK